MGFVGAYDQSSLLIVTLRRTLLLTKVITTTVKCYLLPLRTYKYVHCPGFISSLETYILYLSLLNETNVECTFTVIHVNYHR